MADLAWNEIHSISAMADLPPVEQIKPINRTIDYGESQDRKLEELGIRLSWLAFGDQRLTQLDHRGGVHGENMDRGAADGRKTHELGAVPSKMLAPTMPARVVERNKIVLKTRSTLSDIPFRAGALPF